MKFILRSLSYATPLNNENILNLMSLVNIKHYFTDNCIIFIICTILIDRVNFELLSTLPLPIKPLICLYYLNSIFSLFLKLKELTTTQTSSVVVNKLGRQNLYVLNKLQLFRFTLDPYVRQKYPRFM